MEKFRIAVLASGKGSTFEAIANSCKYGILDANVVTLVSNNRSFPYTLSPLAKEYNIPFYNLTWVSERETRNEYENEIEKYLRKYNPDLIVLAGWNHVLGKRFINSFKNIINLHPALPGEFIGQNCIRKAYNAYQKGSIKYTGSMVHEVIEEIDKGTVIQQIKVPIYQTDTYEDLEDRVKASEKGILIQAIQRYITQHNENYILESDKKPYIGKVRRVEDIGYGCLLLTASDRLSAFDRYICDITDKGTILNHISTWWFKKTNKIVENHFIYNEGPNMIVKKTQPIKLEIVVRSYMTGSSATSIWSMYQKGMRTMYGLTFRDGYKKNEILDDIVLTPTTKGVHDDPLTRYEIINNKYLTENECNFVYEKAYELFRYGEEVAAKRGLILVDTKYEFGRVGDKIILIDELHTCDSSRYWLKDTYRECFDNGREPEKLDKDSVRDWVKAKCDPYKDAIPEIPDNVKEMVENVYKKYYQMLTNNMEINNTGSDMNYVVKNYFENYHKTLVIIIAGSQSDEEHVMKLKKYINQSKMYCKVYYSSAHKNTNEVLQILQKYESENYKGRNIIYVTVAGRSNALSGVVTCNTRYPVIACPPFKDKMDMQVNINSTLQCPSKVPVMTILEPENVSLAINKIFNLI
jgi:formyltetrahydrofolate-dependent phosphoribosylglycinamide formyltransferase